MSESVMRRDTLFYLMVYDLPDNRAANKRRKRLHDLLSGYGTRVQYSVFECFLTAVQFARLRVRLDELIQPEEDCLRIYVLDRGSVKRTVVYGSDRPRQVSAIVL
ncbi:CRISPR-associated endonuclease Cas2 [Phormidium yuhuli AB48]|uniref:CRISPR-associated endoribonuclease Cas2 n=1 Tax=Phormidium yuhuli AB48 TaxID=2940671 RepID=A0ABY5ANP1_9CYAN|nr:CRISPR-associated endonuclease Cas2 [Phormidium yuhuli]USR90839.1 CRISPR-associated endonuclease Cas2 [Phormidium yuhuli AB48]